ncbi:glycoside hydrolase family 26 protein [Streptomyces sp. SLBN-134]|uniref:glycoside hydrolase family 26 protein n=1 Tax=Streptomyces sp. SLBN-134 TaxID=2768456 RepID=UPI001150D3FA|nr:glycosyl hydrolase [Streptomyces sp. SLBN-134]TQL22425.1 glycosyl hydrolase family 26 [Streptomyces sp. SLBN-134]
MAPQHRRVRARAKAVGAAAVVVSAALAAGPAAGAVPADPRPAVPVRAAPAGPPGEHAVPTVPAVDVPAVDVPSVGVPSVGVPSVGAPSVPQPVLPAPHRVPAFGAFLASDERGVARMDELSRWLGGAELRVGHTYLPGNRWSDIEGDIGFLDSWARWRNARNDRMLVLNVPMQERNEEGVPDDEVRALLRRGAAGEFDHHFRALAERLVALKVPDTVVVLGWEMNGVTYTHRCGPDPESWKQYWNRIVRTMRAVPGQKFRFDFTPSRGRDAVPWTECYPGDDTVDIVGMDSYDQPAGRSFDEQVREPYGLQAHVDFAKAHGKQTSYPEWGLFRNGDNPEYMRRMLAWIDRHRPLYNTLTDYCPHGVWQCDDNPHASRVYRSVLSGRTHDGEPETTPQPTPVPTTPPPTAPAPTTPDTPPPPEDCSPLDLGRWVEYWLGGQFCFRFDWW